MRAKCHFFGRFSVGSAFPVPMYRPMSREYRDKFGRFSEKIFFRFRLRDSRAFSFLFPVFVISRCMAATYLSQKPIKPAEPINPIICFQ